MLDEIIEIPFSDMAKDKQWKLENEWKAFHMSPYEHTIKLAADMVFPVDISRWWDRLIEYDSLHCITDVVTHRGDIVGPNNINRRCFIENNFPNVYSDFTYFSKNDEALAFYSVLEILFKNWEEYYMRLEPKTRPHFVSTDVNYAMAARILQKEFNDFSMFPLSNPTMAHLKPSIMDLGYGILRWHKYLRCDINSDGEVTIGNYKQTVPIHYHEKELVDILAEKYERILGV